jgi:hypothetical protein
MRADRCILCQAPLVSTGVPGVQMHLRNSEGPTCDVQVTDDLGVSVDDDFLVEDGQVYALGEAPVEPQYNPLLADVTRYTRVDEALGRIFDKYKLERLGGASSDLGWTSFALFQRCPYAWQRWYLTPCQKYAAFEEPMPLMVGSLVHTHMAVYYQKMLEPGFPLAPEHLCQLLTAEGVDPAANQEAWRLFAAYRRHYQGEVIWPLAVEYKVVNPRTGLSCRYDMIARFPETPSRLAGTYIVETKTSARFDDATLTGWVNDGEVIGQRMLWDQLHLDRRFGELKGVIVNIVGKQKSPMFHRTFVARDRWQVKQHAEDLAAFHALRKVYEAAGTFPRARANCVSKYGKCSEWEHCATGEN